jgi:flagellar biosynthetic protein FliQ
MLAAALVIGLVVSVLQAVTQINEATLVFIPKLLGIGAILLFMGVSMYTSLTDFTHMLIDRMIAAGGS